MPMLDDDGAERPTRSDMHPLARVESEYPITECLFCGMPVPMENDGDVYCNKACQDAHLDIALQNALLSPPLPAIVLFDLEQTAICSCHCH